MALAAPAFAQTNPAAPQTAPQQAAPDRPFTDFAKGSWTAQYYGGYMNELGPHDQQFLFAAAGASYYFVDNMSLGVEVAGSFVSQPGPEAFGGGPQLVFRHHLYNTRDVSFFLDVTAGIFASTEPVPEDGTDFNFIEQFGAGVARRMSETTHLLAGVRYYHLSNAGLDGDDNNPSNNGICLYLGLMFKL